MARHGFLCPCLGHLNQIYEAALAFFEAPDDSLVRELGEVLILHHEVVKVVTQVVSACSAAVTVKDTKEADLGPLSCDVRLALRLENVQDNADAIFIVVANDALVRVSCVRLDDATLLLGCLCWLVILEEERFRIQHGRILTKKESLHLYKLNVTIL